MKDKDIFVETCRFMGKAFIVLGLILLARSAFSDSPIVLVRPVKAQHLPPGTGVVVGADGQNGVVITAAHILKWGRCLVKHNDSWHFATEIGRNDESEVGALMIQWNGGSIPLSDSAPKVGEEIWSWGATSNYSCGNVVQIPDPKQREIKGKLITVDFTAQKGDSGSPFIGTDNRVMGILARGIGTERNGTYVRWANYGPNALQIREDLCSWGWDCSDGKCRKIGSGSAWTPSRITILPPTVSPIRRIIPIGSELPPLPTYPTRPAAQAGQVVMGLPGKQGIPGLPGPPGKSIVGPQGPPGKDATFNLRDFPPFTIEILGANGQVAQTITVPIGGTLQIPPMTMTTIGADGKVYTQTRPLGGEFKLGFFEKEK